MKNRVLILISQLEKMGTFTLMTVNTQEEINLYIKIFKEAQPNAEHKFFLTTKDSTTFKWLLRMYDMESLLDI